jgi:hypothetical protein
MQYDALIAAAKAKRDKSTAKRWTEMDKRTTVSNFLNSGSKHEIVEVQGKNSAYIVTQLNNIIKADDVSELCFATEYEGDAVLVSFVDTAPVEDN